MRAFLLLFAVLCVSACSTPEDVAPPFGLDPSVLVPGVSTSSMTIVTPDGNGDLGMARNGVGRGRIDGREVLYLTLEQEVSQGTMVDSLVVDAVTLAPIRYANVMPGMQTIRTVYGADGSVQSDLVRGDMESHVDTLLSGPYLDAASFTSVLPALPYETGMDVEYPVFHYEAGALTYRVQVPGRETISTCRGDMDAWIVDVTTTANTTRHWIAAESRDMVKVAVDLGGGNRFEQIVVCDPNSESM